MPVNPKKYIDNLIKALDKEGKHYNYASKRFYSTNVGRYVTKYTIQDVDDKENKIEVYNKIEILKYLAREYAIVTGKEIPPNLLT